MLSIRNLFAILLAAVVLSGNSADGGAASERRCYGDWSDAGPVARSEALLPVSQVLKLVSRERVGRVLKVKLCQDNQGKEAYFYKVALSAAGGSVSWLLVDARTGRIEPLVRP